jgi:predicted permease
VWSISYTLLSVLLGRTLTRIFKLPSWVTPAIAFNNTTSLPLLLIESLKQTQILDAILVGGDSAADALDRAESYFLINAMVSNSLTFALGPRLLKPNDEDAPESDDEEEGSEEEAEDEGVGNGNGLGDIERGPDGLINERTSLLPEAVVKPTNRLEKKSYLKTRNWFNSLGPKSQEVVEVAWQFANAPLLGALVGAIIGLTPPLHRLFFNSSNEGGYLNAWLTTSIKNIGDLFASMQIIVVGVKLSQSMLRMKRGENSGEVAKGSLALVTVIRFIIWPLYVFSSHWRIVTNISQNQHPLDLGACLKDQFPRRRSHALVRDDVDADGAAGYDPCCTDGRDWSARVYEDDDCEVLDNQLCDYPADLFCCCRELESDRGGDYSIV